MHASRFAAVAWVASLALLGCGPTADLESARGTQLYFNGLNTGFTRQIVDQMESQLVQGVSQNGWDASQLPRWFEGAQVQFVAQNFPCVALPGQTCAGDYDGQTVTVSLEPGDPWQTAYRHELAHRLQERRGETDASYVFSYDPDHQDQTVWPVVYAK